MANWIHGERFSVNADAIVFVGPQKNVHGEVLFDGEPMCELTSGMKVRMSADIAPQILEAIGRTTEFPPPQKSVQTA